MKPAISIALLLALGTGLAGCQTNDEGSVSDESTRSVTLLGVVIGEQQQKLEEALAPFEEETGIDVIYEGTDAFATLLPIRVDSGNAPDIAMFPQPGLMSDFAREGQLTPITDFLDRDRLLEIYGEDWLNLGTVDDTLYGLWYRVSVKSLVWYSPSAFEEAGYEIPETWDEMITLSDRIVADGNTPWCLGMESGDATGWVGTDWVEDIMLRTASPETYDQWIAHEVKFDSDPVKNAFQLFSDIALNPDYVVGGSVGVISTPFGDSPRQLFDNPPGCYMHRQANFIASFFPEDVALGEDVSVFPLPPIEEEYGLPILVAGDIFGVFNPTPEAQALMEYLTTVEPHESWAAAGGFISPHSQMDLSAYPNEVARTQAEILMSAEVVRFDASDMMPGAVGTGAFWTGVVDYVGGSDVDSVLADIDASWPQ